MKQHREAYEEVGLPLDCPYVQTLAVLEPFISRFKLLVTPVIAFLSDTSVLDSLQASEAEVDRIFTYPLKSILDPSIASKEPLVAIGGEHWPYGEEFYVRFHNSREIHHSRVTVFVEQRGQACVMVR